MFGFEENLSNGFHDVFLNKYTDTSVPIMDLYISDSMQDMLDIDIRTEVATVVGGPNEFSTLMNYYDLPSLELDSNSTDGESNSLWFGGPKWPAINDVYADVGACVNPNSVMPASSSSSNVASLLKSPKGQLNLNNHINQHGGLMLPSPKERKSHLTFSPSTLKLSTTLVSSAADNHKRLSGLAQSHRINGVENVKKDLSGDLKESKINSHLLNGSPSMNNTVKSVSSVGNNTTTVHDNTGGNTIHLAPGIGGLTFASQNMQFAKLKQNVKINNILQQNKRERSSSPHSNINSSNSSSHHNTTSSIQQQQQVQHKFVTSRTHITNKNVYNGNIYATSVSSPSSNSSSSPAHHPHSPSTHHTTTNNNNHHHHGTPTTTKTQKSKVHAQTQLVHEFPKPAYSYSCLIAMALKNSRAGSLPVSEIYSFMCEHFPYFKTAPNGWKNSVRHNLSLNKCFEKIEKPATNGGQRKGCLWAMNPAKISKMDEEVQKWSRKDPMAIRKAMVHPEHLDALERGEMKHGRTGDSDVENNDTISDAEEASDSEPEPEVEENYINTPESLVEEDTETEEEPEVDYDIKLNEYLDDIEIDSEKNVDFYLYEEDLIDGNAILLNPKRARLDINYQITPAHNIMSSFTNSHNNYKQQLHHQQQHHNRRKTPLVNRIA